MKRATSNGMLWSDAERWLVACRSLGYSLSVSICIGHNSDTGAVHIAVTYPDGETDVVVAEERESFAHARPGSLEGAALRAAARLHIYLEGKDPGELCKLARWQGRPMVPSRVAPRRSQ